MTSTDPISRFRVEVPGATLADLGRRLRETRWPDPLHDPDWSYGAEQTALRGLVDYWRDSYDWRPHEARLNRFPQFQTEIDGHRFHFLHVRSEAPNAIPLVITHGWPGSVVEFTKILDPLTDPEAHGGSARDAFHVVCPSLPGYGFSEPRNATGWDTARTARAFAELMARLGYERYAAQGGDFGSFVSQYIALHDPSRCFAVHLNFLFAPPPSAEAIERLDASERARYARFEHYVEEEAAYAQLHMTKPETIGYALTDSPIGQLAWIAEKFRTWTDCDGQIENAVGRDELLTNVTLYWVTRTAPSAARMYRETRLSGAFLVPPLGATPVGHACFPKETMAAPRRWIEDAFNVVQWTDMPRGGHFAAMEQPELLVDDIRRFFRRWR